MFEVKKIDKKNKLVCDIYKISNGTLNNLTKFEDYENKIDGFAEKKKEYIEQISNKNYKSQSKTVFSKCLKIELRKNKELFLFDKDDFNDLIEYLAEQEIFTSLSSRMYYFNILSSYTKWAYTKEYRSDYYTTFDLTAFTKNISAVVAKDEVYTVSEMFNIVEACDRIAVKIAILSMLEGLKSNELLDLTKKQFEDVENHEITLVSGRKINFSDEFYTLCYKYSRQTKEKIIFNYKHVTSSKEMDLVDSPYLMRPLVGSGNTLTDKLSPSVLALIVRKELKTIGIHLGLRTFRQYAMYYSAIKYGLDFTNKKFHSKYGHVKNILTNREIADKMKQKIREEQLEDTLE